MEDAVLHGQAVARILLKLKSEGFTPDVILAHPGWGESLYAKDVFPATRLVHFCEWFYSSGPPSAGPPQAGGTPSGGGDSVRSRLGAAGTADIGFDPEFPVSFDDRTRIRSWNALHLLNLENCDAAISPTKWQKAQHPEAYLDKITVAHEGIDTENLGPDPNAAIKLPSGQVLRAGDPAAPVITYVARNLEPYRGFHQFMRALPAIQREHKTCHTVIVGGDEVSYGRKPEGAKNWREKTLQEVGSQLDPTRTHFLGKVPYAAYKRVLQVSSAHVYLTYPFVLSWSMLEAMATGCFVVGSDTAPVREVVADGVNGRLVQPLDAAQTARRVNEAVAAGPGTTTPLRQRAIDTARLGYTASAGLPAIEDVCSEKPPQLEERNAA